MPVFPAQFKKNRKLASSRSTFGFLLLNFELIICHATLPSNQY
jgi:hypothetical protein